MYGISELTKLINMPPSIYVYINIWQKLYIKQNIEYNK